MKKIFKYVLGALSMLLIAAPVYAADFLAPKSEDDQGMVVVGSSETKKNLYTAGSSVTVNGTIQGDLYAAGASVSVDGPVEKDANVAGANLTIGSQVGDDLRAAGANINIATKIGGDLLAGGSNVNISDKTEIGGDAVIGGANVNMNAKVNGSLKAAGSSITINGEISGPVTVESGSAVVFGPNAKISGKIIVYSGKDPVIKDGAQVSTPEVKPFPTHAREDRGVLGFFTGWIFVQIIAIFLASLVLKKLFRTRFHAGLEKMQSHFWSNLGWGTLLAIAGPIVAILLMITLFGYYLGLLTLAAYFISFLVAVPMAASLTGGWVIMKLQKKTTLVANWQSLLVGSVLLILLGLIPIVGWIFCAVMVLSTFGAVKRGIKDNFEKPDPTPTVT